MELFQHKDNFLDGQHGVTSKIKDSITRVNNEFVYIGFLLWEVREYKYYLDKGYSGVIDYAFEELNFKKSTTYNFIKICEKFSKKTPAGLPTMNLDGKYKDFKYAQLIELSTLKDLDSIDISPDMSVRDIKNSKRLENKISKQVANDIFDKFEAEDPLPVELKDDNNSNIVEVQFAPVEVASSAPNDLLNELEYKKLYDLIDDRYKLIDCFITNGDNVAPHKDLVAEKQLLEILFDKIDLFSCLK